MGSPTPPNEPEQDSEAEAYRGFPLRQVAWGYRQQFRNLLDRLQDRGLLGEAGRTARWICKPFLGGQVQAGQDYLLKQFLTALAGSAGWLLRVPELFRDWRALGAEVAEERVYFGKRYFELWCSEDLPEDPPEVRRLLSWAAELKQTDAELALSFLAGYPAVRRRVGLRQMPQFIQVGLQVHQRSPDSARQFFCFRLRSAEATAERLSRACRLEAVQDRLRRLFRAVAGRGVQISTLSRLDSDELIERGSGTVCAAGHLFLPERVSAFRSARLNRAYYLLAGLLSAACYRWCSFPTVHGAEGAPDAATVCRSEGIPRPALAAFLLQVAEMRRVRAALERRYPGAAGLMAEVAAAEMAARDGSGPAEAALAWAAGAPSQSEPGPDARRLHEWLDGLADSSGDFQEVLEAVAEDWDRFCGALGGAGWSRARPLSFFPDFGYPIVPAAAPAEAVVADLSLQGAPGEREAAEAATPGRETTAAEGQEEGEEGEEGAEGAPRAAFLYDEWNGLEGEYYRDWCRLREVRPEPSGTPTWEDEDFRQRAQRVKDLFQRLRPDLVTREKYLPSGDYIDIDSLVRFITRRRASLSPRVRFWMKPRLKQRDVAVALLLDVSGSTGREAGRRDVIGVEKEAAGVLATGLEELGDRFGVFGFTGNGRRQCVFHVFKDFPEDWGGQAKGRLATARPGSSTRIGVALRHCGGKLREVPSRTRLILLITDGRPMDAEYDPDSRYAHYDVRKACEENRARGIHTFCIGVDVEEPEELEIMFPRGSYAVLRHAEDLPDALARSYLRLTRT